MMNKKLRGVGTAIVTPFDADGKIDERALRGLVDFQIDGGVDFLVPCGTTGESATMNADERDRVVRIVVEQTNGRIPVIAGTSTNDTAQSIEYSKRARAAGVDGLLLVGPYYNKPTPAGYIAHFSAIADSVQLPCVLYNVPGRTASNIDSKTILKLAEHPHIVAVKEASANFNQFMEILQQRPDGFLVLSGDDAYTLPMIALGADGVISVASNQIPGPMTEMVHAALDGNFQKARELHYRYLRLMNINFIESNPIPVKAALAMMGRIQEFYRLPLVPLQPENREKLRGLVSELGLL
jgi:4-hydroxy-tetrahydrodipicolinate synthase